MLVSKIDFFLQSATMITHIISKQFCRRFVQIGFFILSSYCMVTRAQSASYAIINLNSCPICEVQYSYDFSIVVGMAVDNLEGVGNRTNSETVPSILSGDPGTVTPDTGSVIIEEVSTQCGNVSTYQTPVLGDRSSTVVAVLSGECPLAFSGQANEIKAALQLDNTLKVLYSLNIGELSSRPLSDSSSNNTIHMFPLQMIPTTILTLLDFYGWKEVIVLTEKDTQLETLDSAAAALGNQRVVTVTIDSGSLQEPKELLEQILEKDYRVIVLNTYPPVARQFLCQAYHLKKMHYPQYVWILPGWYDDDWWKVEIDNDTSNFGQLTCTSEEMKTMLINSLGVTEVPSDYLGRNEFGSLFRDFDSQYTSIMARNSKENTRGNVAPVELAAFAYDSVWVVAAALSEHNVSDADDYDNKLTAESVLSFLNTKKYFGTSGELAFHETGWRASRQAYVTLYREDSDELLKKDVVGIVQNTSGNKPQFVYTNNESASTVWSGDENPPIRIKINGIILPLTVVYYILATVGILFAVFCIVFNLRFRKYKVIRLSSPNLNYITCAGAIILLLSTYFIGSPSKMTSLFPFLCMGNVWAGAIGASLQYGTIQAKMFRVYVIFRRPGQKNVILKDWHLAMYVAVLVAIDIIMLSVVTAIPEARSVGKLVVDHEHPPFKDSTGATVMSLIHDCESQEKGVDTYWFVLLFGYKLVLQIIVTVLAFLICSTKVEIEALNDHRAVQAITYVNMAILIVSVALAFAVSNFANAKAAVNGLSVLVGAYFNLSLVFIPKMYSLHKDPEGMTIFKPAGNSTSIVGGTPEQSTTSSVASRRVFAKEDNSDASNSGCTQLIVAQHSVVNSSGTNVVMAMDDGKNPQNHMTEAVSTEPHPLSFTIANDSVSGSTAPTPESQSDEAYLETAMDTETNNEPEVLLPGERAV